MRRNQAHWGRGITWSTSTGVRTDGVAVEMSDSLCHTETGVITNDITGTFD